VAYLEGFESSKAGNMFERCGSSVGTPRYVNRSSARTNVEMRLRSFWVGLLSMLSVTDMNEEFRGSRRGRRDKLLISSRFIRICMTVSGMNRLRCGPSNPFPSGVSKVML
jgi:hypothetical protein